MRDPNRIKPYCDTLATIWGMVPDLRLGQLMCNAIDVYKKEYGKDCFYEEDENFLFFLYNYISDLTKEK